MGICSAFSVSLLLLSSTKILNPVFYLLNLERPIMTEKPDYAHFKGKDAIGHVVEAQAQGIIAAAEIHGTEIPGHISAGADAARETAIVLLLLGLVLEILDLPLDVILQIMGVFAFGWLIWKTGRSAWLGWSRLERLHRIIAEEKWEIEHHRQQERDELRVLYEAKGFEGKLLEEVLDVLMADQERLLRVMVEEELGLSLEIHEHPLKQCLGAAIGAFAAIFACIISLFIFPHIGILIGASAVTAISAAISAYHERNRQIPAIVWNLGIMSLAFGFVYFLLIYFFAKG